MRAAARAPSPPARRARVGELALLDQLERRAAEVVVGGAEVDLQLQILGALLRLRRRLRWPRPSPCRRSSWRRGCHVVRRDGACTRTAAPVAARARRPPTRPRVSRSGAPTRASTSSGGRSWIVTGPVGDDRAMRVALALATTSDSHGLATQVPEPPALDRREPEAAPTHREPDRPRLRATACGRRRDDAVRPLREERGELGRVHRRARPATSRAAPVGAGAARRLDRRQLVRCHGVEPRRVEQRHAPLPPRAEHRDERRRRDRRRRGRAAAGRAPRSRRASTRSSSRPSTSHGAPVAQDERAVRQRRERRLVVALRAAVEPLRVEPLVHRVRVRRARDRARATAPGSGRSPRAGTPRTAGGRPRTPSPRRGRTAPCTCPAAADCVRRRPRNSSRHAIQRFTA